MSKNISQNAVMKLLDGAYETALDGLPGFSSAEELAYEYLNRIYNEKQAAKSLMKWQVVKCGASGFITGLGGILTLPVAIPANIASVIYVQMRMVAAIACIGGYDIRDDQVKTLVYACLCGKSATDILRGTGITVGKKVAKNMISKIPGKTLTKINQRVGFRFVTKFGEKGAVNLGKTIPFIGAAIGSIFDIGTTKVIGEVSKNTFIG